jgi:hypothetical protein
MKPVSKTDRLFSINVQAHLTGVRATGMMSTRRYGSQ